MAPRAKRYPAKSSVINFRIQPVTKALLQEAAATSGRTMSAEAEHQLHRALSDMGTGRTHAVMAMIAKTIDGLLAPVDPDAGKPMRPTRVRWWDDQYLFDQAAKVVVAAFEILRPRGLPSPASEQPLGERSARFAIEATLREIQTADLSIPFAKLKPYQRWLALLKQDLGPLGDRAVVWGLSADEARELLALVTPILDELIPLSRKNAKTPRSMSPAEAQRLSELQRKLLEVQQHRGQDHEG